MPGFVRFVLVRTAGDPLALGRTVRGQVAAIDKDQPVSDISTVERYIKDGEAQPRFSVVLTTTFASIGLALAVIGIYSVVSYTFSRRAHEIGVRMALGAGQEQITVMVLRSGLRLAVSGAALGAVGAWALTRLATHLLYKVSPVDPLSFGGACIVLTASALAACYVPARRAARTDPQAVLRSE
jgi:putative ABC transport system permease protein